MNDTAKELLAALEEDAPELWRKCYPRAYQGAGGYESPRYVGLLLGLAILWAERDRKSMSITNWHAAILASRAFDFDLPSFFVAKEFLAAIAQTDLLVDLKWTDAQLPYDAGLLYLPLGVLKDSEGAN